MKFANVLTERSLVTGLSVIEHEGALWIVTGWLEHKTRPVRRPIRLIRMTGLAFEELDAAKHGADYMVNQPIPRAVLDGRTPREKAGDFVVLDTPDLEFPMPNPN